MKSRLALVAVMAALAGIPVAQADEQNYVSADVGVTMARDADMGGISGSRTMTFDNGYLFLAAFGHKFGNGWRLEAEASYRKNDYDKYTRSGVTYTGYGDTTTEALMANGVYDFDTGGPVTPYLGVGIGVANVDYSGRTAYGSLNGSDNVFAYQILAGIGIEVAKQTTLDVGYRFFDPNEIDVNSTTSANDSSHDFMVGLRYSF